MDFSVDVSGRAMVHRRIEMLPLMHTVDRKVIPAEEEGTGNVEEEHFVDDDVAQASKAPKDSPWITMAWREDFGRQHGQLDPVNNIA